TGQGSPPPASAHFLPRQSALTPGHHLAVCRPCAGLQLVVSHETLSGRAQERGGPMAPHRHAVLAAVGDRYWWSLRPAGERCARLQESIPGTLSTESLKRLEPHTKSLRSSCPWTKIHSRRCGATLYEISRLVLDASGAFKIPGLDAA